MNTSFALIRKRRFGPLFGTQFAGALNDNVFKTSLIVLVSYSATSAGSHPNTLINVASALFILPFFLFSATAGQIADKYDKAAIIRSVKLAEVFIMLAAGVALIYQSFAVLVVLLFCMGAQSAFFGPLKFAILPQHLHNAELIGGNAMIETGTFIAILAGTILGGLFVSFGQPGLRMAGLTLVLLAVFGYALSRRIPSAPPQAPELAVSWNVVAETWRNVRFMHRNRTVFLSVLGISWFWFVGATYVTQLASYTRLTLGGNEQVVIVLLAMFSVGIGAGSLLCEKAAGGRVELGLVPLGSIGITIFSLHLFFFVQPTYGSELLNVGQFLQTPGSGWILADLLLIGVSGGLYIVPLQALVQQRSEAAHRARVIAGNNILNALAMVVAALLAMLLLGAGLSVAQLFLVVALMNAAVAIYIYRTVPEFLLRCLAWVLSHTFYRVGKDGLHHVPPAGPAVLVCNHVAYSDPVVIAGAIRRPIRFVMDHRIFRTPLLGYFFRTMRSIPIAPARVDPETLETAYEAISSALRAGELVCIFPEGSLTRTGEIAEFKKGVERILERDPVPVVPMALQGLWGSVFSRKHGAPLASLPRRFWSRIHFLVGPPIPAQQVSAEGLRDVVARMRGDSA